MSRDDTAVSDTNEFLISVGYQSSRLTEKLQAVPYT